ncbi:hypothetical protein HPP92_025082 [Vanilla planifolia]|uniref:Rab-GAP TBC domain-containing protein n=1 Tax=Vanilla planifolia TaxID=51239 RepID=A0A835PJ98_VANPL|nr:hypothetical protein HPP92_025082 [Vanilla planifolia]
MKGKDRKIVTADYKKFLLHRDVLRTVDEHPGYFISLLFDGALDSGRNQGLQVLSERISRIRTIGDFLCFINFAEVDFRDTYGFVVRPQHLQRYGECAKSTRQCFPTFFLNMKKSGFSSAAKSLAKDVGKTKIGDANNDLDERNTKTSGYRGTSNNDQRKKVLQERTLPQQVLERNRNLLAPIDEVKPWEENFNQEFYDMVQQMLSRDLSSNIDEAASNHVLEVPSFPWKRRVGMPGSGGCQWALEESYGKFWVLGSERWMDTIISFCVKNLTRLRRDLMTMDTCLPDLRLRNGNGRSRRIWFRTFPGHPALDEDGRNALRRVAYSICFRHNPSVGYCQVCSLLELCKKIVEGMLNKIPSSISRRVMDGQWRKRLLGDINLRGETFEGDDTINQSVVDIRRGKSVLLITSIRTLLGIIDDYFEGYYSEEMIESQAIVTNHLDYLGVQVAWVTWALVPFHFSEYASLGKWSVLRIWDVLLFDGNRVMLFRTALALMELYGTGSCIGDYKGCWDAVTLLQSLASSTFDSSLLVLTACMGFQSVNEGKLQELRKKHRHEILASMKERSRGLRDSKDLLLSCIALNTTGFSTS